MTSHRDSLIGGLVIGYLLAPVIDTGARSFELPIRSVLVGVLLTMGAAAFWDDVTTFCYVWVSIHFGSKS